MTDGNITPIGGLALYGGDLSVQANRDALLEQGWLVCDGAAYTTNDYPALYGAIKNSHGGDGSHFNVPDLRDRFVRGVNGSANVDPDAGSRTVAAAGGASGNAVGSYQAGGTAMPRKPWILTAAGDHAHTYEGLNTDMDEAWGGSSYTAARWSNTSVTDPAGAHSHTLTGGDAATVPVNAALYWIIRALPSPSTAAEGSAPAGAIVAYGAPTGTAPTGWLYCNGMAQAIQGPNAALAAMIGSNYGGDGVTVFDLPDLRGRFLRGTAHGMPVDPDAASRSASQPGGNTGDQIGSLQSYATGNPSAGFTVSTAGAHTHALAHDPNTAHNVAYGASGPLAWNVMEWNGGPTWTTTVGTHTHDISGGDAETRPVNIYLDWLIAFNNTADAPPIGAILPFSGDITDIGIANALYAAGWLPCAGGKLKINDAKYQALYNVIGNTFGANALAFFLPDVQGYFVIGAGKAAKVGQVQTGYQTGTPFKPFTTTAVGDHQHSVTGTNTDTQRIDVVLGWSAAMDNDQKTASSLAGEHSHPITSGGDSESRPVNVYVDYIIRFH